MRGQIRNRELIISVYFEHAGGCLSDSTACKNNKIMTKVTVKKDGTMARCEGCGAVETFEMKSGVQKRHADFARRHRSCKGSANEYR